MVRAQDFGAFAMGCLHDHLDIIKQLYVWGTEEEKALMIAAAEYDPFKMGCKFGRLSIIKQLYHWTTLK